MLGAQHMLCEVLGQIGGLLEEVGGLRLKLAVERGMEGGNAIPSQDPGGLSYYTPSLPKAEVDF